uniref:RNA polymerase II-associated protein 3 isoform X1 n=1 Tax=Rhizophora mucronata TaxID=61149 RepID=A0A2P2L404_RHIMU
MMMDLYYVNFMPFSMNDICKAIFCFQSTWWTGINLVLVSDDHLDLDQWDLSEYDEIVKMIK